MVIPVDGEQGNILGCKDGRLTVRFNVINQHSTQHREIGPELNSMTKSVVESYRRRAGDVSDCLYQLNNFVLRCMVPRDLLYNDDEELPEAV